MQETFESVEILFWIVGMGFGCSYSLVEVDCIDWVKTDWRRKLARTLLVIVITSGCFLLVEYFGKSENELTEFVLFKIIPMLAISFVMYGPFLVVCNKCKLVGTSSVDDDDPDFKFEKYPTLTSKNTQRETN